MTYVDVDAKGALLDFSAVPPQRTSATAPPGVEMDWQPVFDAVRWPRARFTPVTPEWTPPVATDTRAAWTGTVPELGSTPLRLEAGAFAGKVVFVQTVGPWTQPGRVPRPIEGGIARALDIFKNVLVLFLIVGSALLARRMVVLGRGDWRGATTVSLVLFILGMAQWVVGAHHVPDYGVEQDKFFDACANLLFRSGIAWLAYLGIEPWIRRHWPTSLISWSRMLAGSFRDPLVGRDVLIGTAFGVAGAIYPGLIEYAFHVFGGDALDPAFTGIWALTTPRFVGASLLNGITNALFNTLLLTLLYVVFRRRLGTTVAGGDRHDRRADDGHHRRGRLRLGRDRLRADRVDLGVDHRAAAFPRHAAVHGRLRRATGADVQRAHRRPRRVVCDADLDHRRGAAGPDHRRLPELARRRAHIRPTPGGMI